MALIFMEGFDSLPSGNNASIATLLRQTGWVESNMADGSTTTRTGRGYALRLRPSSPSGQREATAFFASPLITGFVCGFACNFIDGQGDIFNVQYDNLAGSLVDRFKVYKNNVAGLSVLDANDNLLAASDNNVIFPAEWNYIEVKAQIEGGIVQVKVNGCIIINASGLDLGESFNRYGFRANFFGDWNNGISQNLTLYDDIYLCDLTGGGVFADFLGDVVIEDLRPEGDYSPNQLTAVGIVGDHYQAVDEQSSDGDTTYLATDQTDYTERFSVTDLPEEVIDVIAMSVGVRGRRDGTGYRTFRCQVHLGGETIEGDDKFTSTGHQEWTSIFTTKPGGGLWTVADANNMAIGFRTTETP